MCRRWPGISRCGPPSASAPAVAPSPADLELLAAYDWPGNVRELAAVIERATILGEGKSLKVAEALGTAAAPVALHRPAAPAGRFLTLDDAMARHIEAALTQSCGRIEGADGAAHLLGINPHTLRARMRKLGVDWQRFRGVQRAGDMDAVRRRIRPPGDTRQSA